MRANRASRATKSAKPIPLLAGLTRLHRAANGVPAGLGWGSAIALLLAATFFRTVPLLDNRFHPDEALYGSFARRIASGRDPLLAQVLVDKPPLGFYLTSLGLVLFGNNEFGARLPTLYASVVSVALLVVVARRLYNPATALLAGTLLAASPFAILFSITLFLDPLLTATGLWALTGATRTRWRTVAVALAMGFAVKQTALIYVPLALALGLLRLPEHTTPRAAVAVLWKATRWLLPALAVTALAVFVWDAVRQHPIGFWSQGYSDNMPGRFVRTNEVAPRALAWINLLHYGTASTALNSVWVAGAALQLVAGARARSRAALADALLLGYLLLYLGGYWLLAFNVWDRYLLPILPLLLLLAARGLAWLGGALGQVLRGTGAARVAQAALALVVGFSLLPGAVTALRSGYPVGGDHGAYDGIDDAAHFLSTLPEGTVLYDHWLSWQWGFYLFDAPIYVAWMPSPAVFTTDLRSFGHTSRRYFVVPSWEQDGEMRAAAASAGFEFVPRHQSYRRDGSLSLSVYELAPLAAPDVGAVQ